MKASKIFSINWLDVLKGLILGVIASFLDQVLSYLMDPNYHLTWASAKRMLVIAVVSYLIKNFFTPSPKQNADT